MPMRRKQSIFVMVQTLFLSLTVPTDDSSAPYMETQRRNCRDTILRVAAS